MPDKDTVMSFAASQKGSGFIFFLYTEQGENMMDENKIELTSEQEQEKRTADSPTPE